MSKASTIWNRRQFLTALGLGAGSLYLPSLLRGTARAQSGAPTRVVFYITPHGTVPSRWHMRQSGRDNDTYDFSLGGLGESQFSEILRPLHRHRDKLLIVDGLCRATTLAEEYRVARDPAYSGDLNRHHLGQAHLLTSNWSYQGTSTARGGSRTVDQVIGDDVGQPGRWKSRVYGFNHQHAYNYVALNEPAPREADPGRAFSDILGLAPEPTSSEPTRAQRIRAARGSALDMAADEFERIAPRLGSDDREKLERHRDLVRDLEISLSTPLGPGCDPSFTEQGHVIDQFSRLTAMALACDLTRVVTLVTQNIPATQFGAPSGIDVHQDVAHNAAPGAGGFQHMVNYNRVYAEHFAHLLDQLDSVPEDGGTLLDHTAVVWLTELSTGAHDLHQAPNVIAGGANGYFRPGRYLHYGQTNSFPDAYSNSRRTSVGLPQSRLYVSLMHAMGMTNRDSFGLSDVNIGGTPMSLRNPLPNLI